MSPTPLLGEPAREVPPGTRCVACPLRRLPSFRQNTEEEVVFIQGLKVGELRLRARSDIVREGEVADRLYTLLSGWAFRHKTLPDGRRQILNFLLPGDLIGLQSKLFDRALHGVEALTDVTLCCFSRDRIWEIFRLFPQLAYDVTWLGAREESLVDDNLFSVGRRSAAERVAALVLQIYRRASALTGDERGSVKLPLTQAHIADALGLSSVHTNRTLQSLRKKGLFDLSAGTLRLRNVKGLQELAGEPDIPNEQRPLI